MAKFFPGDVLLGTSLTGSYQLLLAAPAQPVKELIISNDCNKPVLISLNGSVLRLPAATPFVIGDISSDFSFVPSVQVKHDGEAPTTGKIQAFAMTR